MFRIVKRNCPFRRLCIRAWRRVPTADRRQVEELEPSPRYTVRYTAAKVPTNESTKSYQTPGTSASRPPHGGRRQTKTTMRKPPLLRTSGETKPFMGSMLPRSMHTKAQQGEGFVQPCNTRPSRPQHASLFQSATTTVILSWRRIFCKHLASHSGKFREVLWSPHRTTRAG